MATKRGLMYYVSPDKLYADNPPIRLLTQGVNAFLAYAWLATTCVRFLAWFPFNPVAVKESRSGSKYYPGM
jgi:hypothetical protein